MVTSSQSWRVVGRVVTLCCFILIGLFAQTQYSSVYAQTQGAARPADSATTNLALSIVQNYQGTWTSPPTNLTSGETQDGPLMGNGDVGVVVGGTINNMTFYIGKNDFFSASSHAIKPLGRILLAVPGLAGSSYNMVEDILHAEVRGTFSLNGATLNTTSWVSATSNMFITTLALTGGSAQSATITLQDGFGNTPV